MKKALTPLQFVEKDTIQTTIKARRVTFKLTDTAPLDMEQVISALKSQGFKTVEVVHTPG